MNLFRRTALVAAFVAAVCSPAAAQWQTPNHSVPMGRGAGATGFGSAAPGASGGVLTSTGPGTDPTFQVIPPPTGITNSQLAPMNADTTKCNNTLVAATAIDCTVAQFKTLQSINISVTDPAYGAKGDCTTDDTAAFQAALNAANGATGAGTIYVPATSSCYLITKIDGTNRSNVIWSGAGDQSLIKINGADANGNWWDLSGSSNVQFKNLKFIDNSTAKAILFLWACTGISCGQSGILTGLSFDHVNVRAKTTSAALYGYGFGCVGGAGCNGGGSLNISNSTWIETNNGAAAGDYLTGIQNALLVLDAQNSRNVRSVYVTLTTTAAVVWRANIRNVDFIDYSNGAVKSNNSAAVFYNTNQLRVDGGSFQCVCFTDIGIYHQSEGMTFTATAFEQPDGGAAVTFYWVYFAVGHADFVTFINPFWSGPGVGFIGIGLAVSGTDGGVGGLRVIGNDVGLNPVPVAFIATATGGCGGTWPAANNWLVNAQIDFIVGANTVTTCGSIDAHTIFQNVGVVSIPGGAVDNSHHF